MEQPFEKLGAFYLGRVRDIEAGKTTSEYLLYDARDLTTHAVCVGMTGSGKTGLCISLLEEAGIDGIPAIAVDPKGDIGNLLLTFPQLRAEDFRPWIDEAEAARQGQPPDQFAQQTADGWRQGLAEWDQDGARIERFRSAVDLTIYTPGSTAGVPLTVLKSFQAPAREIIDDVDIFRQRVASASAGLMALLGLDVDPVRSREFILVSNLLDRAWRDGRDMDIAGLIREIQSPPFESIGVMEVDTFFPAKDRVALSMALNSLLASPSFAGWLEGEPLDIKRLLYSPAGKPRISILSIAHLSEAERMFFVTILLNELLAWVRSQPGTPSLRALFYMDEVFGYFPPVANPPSKTPMLTLLKQARAFGLGLVLATQNPVDLDYKGLSNCGTWLLGRLQTERDKARVLDGLEGASSQAGARFDRQKMDVILSGLGGRVFLMNNVHEEEPVVFQTRWALSYLRGPLTRDQIRTLTAQPSSPEGERESPEALPPQDVTAEDQSQPSTPAPAQTSVTRRTGDIPANVPQQYLAVQRQPPPSTRLVYFPALLGSGNLHFVRAAYHVDHWEPRSLLATLRDDLGASPWAKATLVTSPLNLSDSGAAEGEQEPVPEDLTIAKNFAVWQRHLADFLYRTQTLEILQFAELKEYSKAGETAGDFRIRLVQRLHEQRDAKVQQLRERYAAKLRSLEDRIRRAQDKVSQAESEYHQESMDTAVSIGKSIFGALLGRKKLSRANVDRASSSARRAGRVAREKGDVQRARDNLDTLLQERMQLDDRIAAEVAKIDIARRPDQLVLEHLQVRPRKSDISLDPIAVVWTPWFVDSAGSAERAF